MICVPRAPARTQMSGLCASSVEKSSEEEELFGRRMALILEFAGALLVALALTLVGQLLVLASKNKKKYQFFAENAPGLKVLENPSLFGGHTNQLFHNTRNVFRFEEVLERCAAPTVGWYLGTRPAVVTIDLDFVKQFTVDEQVHTNRALIDIPVEEAEKDSIMFSSDEQWLLIRRALAPAFTTHKIKSPNVQEDIEAVVEKFMAMVERRLDGAPKHQKTVDVDAEDLCSRYALELIFKNFYKQDGVIDFEAGEHEEKFVELVSSNLRDAITFPIQLCAAFPVLKPALNWLLLNFHPQGKLRNKIMNYIKQQTKLNLEASQIVDQTGDNFRLKDGSKFRRNMIDYITDQYREGKLTRNEYFNSTFFLFFAANNTIGDSMSRLMYNLAHNQRVQEKLRESVSQLGLESEYLGWVINESLRLHPPVPIGCSRVLKHDIQTGHGLVPAGTFVLTPARTINRLPQYWGEDADEFRPERWAKAKDFHPCQNLTFGGGRRACPGKELALKEIKMLLVRLVQQYKFQRSQLHPADNSHSYTAPMFSWLAFESPTYVRISRVSTQM